MEETYPTYVEEPIYEGAPAAHYENYTYSHGHASAPRTSRYDTAEYDTEYRTYREYREPPAYAGKNVPPIKKARHDNYSDHYYYYWYWTIYVID